MKKLYRLSVSALIVLMITTSGFSQNYFFTDAGENTLLSTTGARVIIPQKFRAAGMDVQAMKNFLWSLPSEKNITNRRITPVMTLLMPDGKQAKFHVWESSIQEPVLAAKFPEIKTFIGQGIDDPYATVRMDFGPNGFHAQVLTVNGTYYIDPYARGVTDQYISYYRSNFIKTGTFLCEVPENPNTYRPEQTQAVCLGTELRTYRLAVACTGEYAQAPGINAGSNPAILHAAIVTSVNRVVGVYEQEVAVRMILVANNNLVEFLDAATDPFTGNNNANVLINESQTVIDANIGSANYDIGHTFSTGGGGLAQLSCVCSSNKARGITGSPNPTGDPYDIDYVAHEMGHQFGGNHSMSGCGSSPVSTKYEVGSGTTIQAYAGICGSQDIQPHSDPFFHAISFDEISDFVNGAGGTCAVVTSTGNTLPVIDPLPNNGLSIPPSTPFVLTGTASDANGDPLTYCWEQWDFNSGGGVSWNAGATGPVGNTYPLFKSRIPKTNGTRMFPDIAVILAGYPANPPAVMGGLKGETLSPVARPMKFRLTVRDNRAGGGGVVSAGSGCQSSAVFQINVVGTTPFTVTSPNGGETYTAGATQTITWDVAGTNSSPVSVANVKISLSSDGGLTYPIVIFASTANDGTETFIVPAVATTTAKVKVEALGNIFFDISNADFTILVPAGFNFNSPAAVVADCPAPATMTSTNLTATYFGGHTNNINLTASGAPGGTNVTFSNNPLTTGSPSTTVTLNNANTLSPGSYTITVTGTSSGAPTQTRDIVFTINPGTGPTITTHPSSQALCEGGNVTFTVATSAGSPTYQWQLSTNGGANWNNIAGATTSSYTINGVTAVMNNNQYRCMVSVQCGSTNSNAAILTVNTGPVVTSQPQNATVCVGGSNAFVVTATGGGLSYQWQLSTDGGANYNDIGGATLSTYTVSGATIGMNGYRYRCIVTGACSPPATSTGAILTVIAPVAITSQPGNAELCSGSNTSFTVAGSSTQTIIYQWQVSTDGGASWNNVSNGGVYSGATTATLTITGATASMSANRYRCMLSNATCTTPTVSGSGILTVRQLPSVGLAAAPLTTLLPGQTTTLTSTPSASTGGTLSATWYFNGSAISNTGNTRVVNVEQVGDYQVRIQETWPSTLVCSNQSPVVTITATASDKLFIFPSPNNGNFVVSYYNSGGGSTQRRIIIFNSSGQKAYDRQFSISGAYTLLNIDMQRGNTGIHIVEVFDNTGKKLAEGKVHIR
ncbi:MAG: hypothetical protein HZB42_07580 [Sphingobacteriales bacterium]|nr:hypothetical protein [Sphingobacteriales bacterium]